MWLFGVVAVYTLVFVRMAIPEERTRVIEYGVLAILMHEALAERRQNGGNTPPPTVSALALASFIGLVDEVIQLFLPSRVFDVADIITNSASVALALGTKLILGWARDRRT